ncbi:MAG: UDP-N-acetylglucosamine--N-acetylmuramyl-(pentapeptide) pyrophosphoryl-undecaprenol N-acetylglucosamine transferase [Planctomycetes bacterium]|nr:UDP-N-acetylglucosamine--N-acetylmuramyl-(pentapeptide) pyrophosphoryl-undecaprenol N-acetylglucosamine transferase [Planctomycetota bacterium]
MSGPVVLFAGGGTGGHLLPGVAAAERIRALAPGARVLFATTDRDEAGAWGGSAEGDRLPVASPRLPRGPREVPSFLGGFASSLAGSLGALRRNSVDAVVGLGGYGSVGPALAALATGRTAVVLEANVVPGAANRLLARLGATAAVSFEETGRLLPGERAVHTGNPLRSSVLAKRRDPASFGLDGSSPVLAVVGGSLGARGLNDRIAAFLPRIAAAGAQLLWVTGPGDSDRLGEAARRAGVRAAVLPFCRDMAALYGTADLLLARAGGGTVAEVAALGVAAVFVPYPHHADRQQARNAGVLADRGAARVVEEEDLTEERFRALVLPLLLDAGERERMAAAARSFGRPDAADRVARLVLDRIHPSRPAAAAAKEP